GSGGGRKGRDEMDGRRGPAEAQDTALGAAPAHTTARHTARDSIPGDGGPHTTTADGCPRNHRSHHPGNDPLPATTTKKRKLDCDDGDGDAPFCGLMFPGILLKFWVPGSTGGAMVDTGSRSSSRDLAVSRLQAVVNSMLQGLTPSYRKHPLARGPAAHDTLDDMARSALVDDGDEAMNAKIVAWDNFVQGTHALLVRESWQTGRGARANNVAGPSERRDAGGDAGAGAQA
ncbi:unnamed protein product, partial [Sphacelaria rigidula]